MESRDNYVANQSEIWSEDNKATLLLPWHYLTLLIHIAQCTFRWFIFIPPYYYMVRWGKGNLGRRSNVAKSHIHWEAAGQRINPGFPRLAIPHAMISPTLCLCSLCLDAPVLKTFLWDSSRQYPSQVIDPEIKLSACSHCKSQIPSPVILFLCISTLGTVHV